MSNRARWGWWFGAPWFAFGLTAWWLQSEVLLIVAVLFLGLAGVAFAVDGVRTGVIEAKWAEYDWTRHPFRFWFHVVLYVVLGVGLLVGALARLVT